MRSIKKKYYKELDIVRVIACIAILMYHLNILKGGYLAVCTFLVLSGYLSFISAYNKKKFSLKKYYKHRLLKLYLPLLVVIFISLVAISLIPSIELFNIKPETTSIIFGYNNYWQLSANLDYFARHISSPFMHFWYIAIIIQFDMIFPFIFIFLQKLKNKYSKETPCMMIGELSIIAVIYFFIMSLGSKTMTTYYSTFTRIFSVLFGLWLGLIHSYFKPLISKKIKNYKVLFYTLIMTLILLFIFIDAKSVFFSSGIILTTLITYILIDISVNIKTKKTSKITEIIKYLSSISYEIYLVQYPVIFIFQYLNITSYLKIPIIIILVFIISSIFHYIFNFNNENKKILRYVLSIIIFIITLVGVYQYFVMPNYTKEMKALEEELAKNQEVMNQKQKEYESKLIEEENNWLEKIKSIEDSEKEINTIVSKLSVVGVGDSVMLGAIDNLYKTFSNGYFDAEVSRTAWKANDILKDLKAKNKLGNTIIFNLGVNGDCSNSCKEEIIKTCGNREIYWLNVGNDKKNQINKNLEEFASKYNNVHIIDWASASNGHKEYFVADGVHLTNTGKKAYTETIYNAIYQEYLKAYQEKLNNTLNEYDNNKKNKVTFYGNDILLYIFDDLQENFEYSKFNLDSNYNYEKLKNKLEESINNNTLTNKIVLAFDSSLKMTSEQYEELINLCHDKKLYILSINKETTEYLLSLKNENVTIIDFYKELKNNNDYLSLDKVHLTSNGNKALSKILKDKVK